MAREELITNSSNEHLSAVNNAIHYAAPTFTCPKCGSHNVDGSEDYSRLDNYWNCTCKDCGYHWKW